MNSQEIKSAVEQVLAGTAFVDIHMHLFHPSFGKLALWGIDERLTDHYLGAELFRFSRIRPDSYWAVGYWLDFSHGAYEPIFFIVGTAYLAAFLLINPFVRGVGEQQ